MSSHRPRDQKLTNIWAGYGSQSSEDDHHTTNEVDDQANDAAPSLAPLDITSDDTTPIGIEDYSNFDWTCFPFPPLQSSLTSATKPILNGPGVTKTRPSCKVSNGNFTSPRQENEVAPQPPIPCRDGTSDNVSPIQNHGRSIGKIVPPNIYPQKHSKTLGTRRYPPLPRSNNVHPPSPRNKRTSTRTESELKPPPGGMNLATTHVNTTSTLPVAQPIMNTPDVCPPTNPPIVTDKSRRSTRLRFPYPSRPLYPFVAKHPHVNDGMHDDDNDTNSDDANYSVPSVPSIETQDGHSFQDKKPAAKQFSHVGKTIGNISASHEQRTVIKANEQTNKKNKKNKRKQDSRPTTVNGLKDDTVRNKLKTLANNTKCLQHCSSFSQASDRRRNPAHFHFLGAFDEMVRVPNAAAYNNYQRVQTNPSVYFLVGDGFEVHKEAFGRELIRVGKMLTDGSPNVDLNFVKTVKDYEILLYDRVRNQNQKKRRTEPQTAFL